MPIRRFRVILAIFIVCLVASGVTAFPLLRELRVLTGLVGLGDIATTSGLSGIAHWIVTVRLGLEEMYAAHPWIAYGTDWLAFGHIVIALSFVGAWKDPVRNRWLFQFGMLACALVIPWALVFGAVRGIPFWWRLIDSSFGVVGFVPAWLCHRRALGLELAAERAG